MYLTKGDIARLVQTGALLELPVKIEHTGTPVGKVISAWEDADRLDCIFKINDDSIDSIFAQEFVKNRKTPELSHGLTYNVTMQHSKDGTLSGDGKELIEVSIVKQGARNNCKIYGHS